MEIRILIADDHAIFRTGLATLLKKIARITSIKLASNGKEVLEIIKAEDIDVILMDINMPLLNGIETTRHISMYYDHIKVIALSMYDDQHTILEMNNAGAMGYLLKNTEINELRTAIYSVMRGEKYFSKEVSELLLERAIKGGYLKTQKKVTPLTERDKVLILYICKGLSAAEIAAFLGVAEKTVEGHKTRIFSKTGVKNVAALVLYAVRHGIVDG